MKHKTNAFSSILFRVFTTFFLRVPVLPIIVLFYSFILSPVFAQEETKSKANIQQQSNVQSINSTQATGDKFKILDDEGNVLMGVKDEGTFGSIFLPPSTTAPSGVTSKLYNIDGVLHFQGWPLGGSAGGWADDGSVVHTISLSDKVGIQTSTPLSILSVGGDGDVDAMIYAETTGNMTKAVYGYASSASTNTNYGGYFSADGGNGVGAYGLAQGNGGKGVQGIGGNSTSTVANYGGYFEATGSNGVGAYGGTAGTNGRGVEGYASNTDNGLHYGGYFEARGSNGSGVRAYTAGLNSYGVYGESTGEMGRGVYGWASQTSPAAENFGGYFKSSGGQGIGVYGEAVNNNNVANYGGKFLADGSNTGYGIYAEATGANGFGVYGLASNTANVLNYGGYFVSDGLYGRAIYGEAPSTGYAGYFNGNVLVTGTISKGSGSFKIDHPLDPENKYLYHSFLESPDMMNIYNGNIITDGSGDATVFLPEWFDALNKDFKYQLTVIGDFAQAIIYKEIRNNQFSIKTDKPNIEVSWQVTGIRHDAFANKNRIQVEEEKNIRERGKYLHPEAFGKPRNAGIAYNEIIEQEKVKRKNNNKVQNRNFSEEQLRADAERKHINLK